MTSDFPNVILAVSLLSFPQPFFCAWGVDVADLPQDGDLGSSLSTGQASWVPTSNQTWLAGKSSSNGGFSRKIADASLYMVHGPFSSKPCLMTEGLAFGFRAPGLRGAPRSSKVRWLRSWKSCRKRLVKALHRCSLIAPKRLPWLGT